MGLRFRKSITICKGIKLNFNKDSYGLSIGGKGFGYTINSKGKRTSHIGIPGTGLSYTSSYINKKYNTNNSNKAIAINDVSFRMDDDGKIRFFYSNGTEITDPTLINRIKRTSKYKMEKAYLKKEHDKEMLNEINEFNQYSEYLTNINQFSFSPICNEQYYIDTLNNLKPEIYEKQEFKQLMPTKEIIREELMTEAISTIKSKAFWTLKNKYKKYIESNIDNRLSARINEWKNEKEMFEKEQLEIEEKTNQELKAEFENTIQYYKNIINGDEECINSSIDDLLKDFRLPLEFNLNYEYSENNNSLWIDFDLPEIEDFPSQIAVQLANGNAKLKNKTKRELNSDYKKFVFGLAVLISSYLFNVSPKILNIIVSGYTQRRNSSGDINDDYVYSIIFERDTMSKLDYINEDPYEICLNFKNRCNPTSTDMLKSIEPFSMV
ncbi:MAG: DUF4236 domain-containing protein [Firmicutes bacterium]|nr:DUF4236 domain-containing protein [Bacillota bacterium]